jgi:hypothetical protein
VAVSSYLDNIKQKQTTKNKTWKIQTIQTFEPEFVIRRRRNLRGIG